MPCNRRVVALVMAAGLSRRFGSDKRRARLTDGRSLLQATLAQARAGFDTPWVVLRESDVPAELGIADTIPVVHAPADDSGLGTSLAAAFRELEARREKNIAAIAAAVMLGDMPWVSPATCRRLMEHAHPEHILRPRHGGQLGHPVVFGRAFWPRLSRLSGDQGARQVVKENASACEWIDVDDPGVLRDVDVPKDLHP